jgi:PAS domain S-box-containing protein
MKKKLSDSTEIRIKYAEEHALRVLEERNIAFRVLYDTVLEVEGACEETIFGILCRNLRRIAKAKWAALASYAPHRSTFTLEAVSTEDDRAADPGKYSSPGITVPVNETVVENFLQSQIRECSHEVCLVSLFPGSILNRASHTGDSMCYRISFIREKTLIAAGMVQLPDGQTLKMKDLVNTYLNLAGMILQRINEVNALRKSEEQYRRIFDSVTDCLIVFDLNGNIVEANPAACRLYGYTRDEMVQLSGQDIMSRDYHHVFQNLKESLFSVGKFHSQSVDVRKDGSLMNIDIQGTTFEYNGAPHILAIIRDVTERKKMENELMKIQKLESLGILAGGIAHDFNNMLNAIIGNLNLARTFFDQKEKTLERIQNAEKVAYEATSLSKQLLTFSKGGVPVKKIVSLPKLLKEASEFTLAGSNVSARTQIPEDLKSVEADAGQIKQIVQNLVVNARQAMPDGGIVRIECDNVSLPSDNSLALDQGEYVRYASPTRAWASRKST